LIRETVGDLQYKSLLDIGCHNGNLLYQMKQELPGLILSGGDIIGEMVAQCQVDPELKGICFDTLDILDLKCLQVDIITVNALLGRFNDEQHRLAWENISRTLKTGGWIFAFEWYHPFHQTLRIIEETPEHPEGLTLTFRSQHDLADILKSLGFTSIAFHPFLIGIDLPLADHHSALLTHTRHLVGGDRLLFRGTLCQPWCHLAARKA